MKKITKRSKQELAKDVASVLVSELHPETKKIVIDNALWNWSGFDGKIKGCRYWTKTAWNERETAILRHEHVVPRTLLIQELLESGAVCQDEVYTFFETYCIGVVVTKEQDDLLNQQGLKAAMPPDWCKADPWARYKHAGLWSDVFKPYA